jgi:hypothetical protein
MFCISLFFGPDGLSSLVFAILSNYVGHMALHDDLFYFTPYAILHRYHHENHSPFTYFFNILSEFSILTVIWNFLAFNPWSLLFNAINYISVHYINCSWLHINEYHEKHHARIDTNIAPDILDGLFGTKHPDTLLSEDTTHMIPNILVSAAIVFWLKAHYKPSWDRYFCYFSTGLFITLIAASTFILKHKV